MQKHIKMTEKEFEILSSELRGTLQTLVSRFTRAAGIDAEDIVQESLLTLWRLYEDGYPVRNPTALAIKITKSTCVAHYRRKQVSTQRLDRDDYRGGEEATTATDIGDCRILRRKILSALSETQKEYLRLRNEEQLSLDEIASLTGKPKNSIKSTISSARKTIMEIFRKEL